MEIYKNWDFSAAPNVTFKTAITSVCLAADNTNAMRHNQATYGEAVVHLFTAFALSIYRQLKRILWIFCFCEVDGVFLNYISCLRTVFMLMIAAATVTVRSKSQRVKMKNEN